MKEKFDRNSPHVNIGEIGRKVNESSKEKIAILEETKKKIQGAIINQTIKNDLISNIDEMADNLDQQNTFHR